jgi:methionine-rich copper-binding protein CopC
MKFFRKRSTRALGAMLFATLLLALPHAAFAHAVLVSSTPPEHGTVKSGNLEITLKYNSRIDATRSSLTLVAADGTPRSLTIDTDEGPNVLESKAHVSKGKYTVRWQVLASDGHITRGTVEFSVE